MKKLKNFEEITLALLHERHLMKSLDMLVEANLHSVKVGPFLEAIDKLKTEGYVFKADLAFKRIQEIKKQDEMKLKNDKDHKITFVDWVIIINN